MSVEILDGNTILNFVEDDAAFTAAVRQRFDELDADHDGILSYDDMLRELQSLRVLDMTDDVGFNDQTDAAKDAEVYRSLFAQFDRDSDGAVSLEEYVAETKDMMLAIARDIGSVPVQIVLEESSLIHKAVKRVASASAAIC